jgi:hypothetical protein
MRAAENPIGGRPVSGFNSSSTRRRSSMCIRRVIIETPEMATLALAIAMLVNTG